MVIGLVVVALGGSAAFFLRLYSDDKLAQVFEGELAAVHQIASRLENLIAVSKFIAPDRVKASRDILFLIEKPCTPGAVLTESEEFTEILRRLPLSTEKLLLPVKEVTDLCRLPEGGQITTHLLGPGLSLGVPAILVLTQGPTLGPSGIRVVGLSMDGQEGPSASSSVWLTEAKGQTIWREDAIAAGKDADPRGTILDSGTVEKLAAQAIQFNSPSVVSGSGREVAAFAPVLSEWVTFLVTPEQEVLRPVYFVIRQLLLFLAGFLFLCILAGKKMADVISRPIAELRAAAQRLGDGDLTVRFQDPSEDEIGAVKRTFNTMAGQIVKLVADTETKAKMESEILLAQKVQQMLLPKSLVRAKGHEIHSFVRMASKCGGDWWGYLEAGRPAESPLLLLLIGDVTGHGTSSALVTAAAQGGLAILKSWVEKEPSIAQDPRLVLKLFNRAVFQSSGGDIHMTFFATVLDRARGELHCSNAGHNLPYLLIPSETGTDTIAIGGAGTTLGREDQTEFSDFKSHPWKEGYQLFLYTDGLTDCVKDDKNLFDRRALVRLLKRHGKLRGRSLLETVLAERQKVAGGIAQEDDITAVVCLAIPES